MFGRAREWWVLFSGGGRGGANDRGMAYYRGGIIGRNFAFQHVRVYIWKGCSVRRIKVHIIQEYDIVKIL